MRKIVLVIGMILIASSVFAYDISTERVLNAIYDSGNGVLKTNGGVLRGTMTTHRSAVSTVDTVNPALASGVNCSGYRSAKVDIDSVKGTQWTVTPLYGNSTANAYMAGSSTVVSGDAAILVDVYGSTDVYMRLDSYTDGGSGHTVTVYVTPVN